mmetsp:Transcript_17933/g.32090  ORF Transcript_17933/g.32090 Transcript_17933/m.32090 type:complete len:149 (+) Transcript_17933:131-577(+)
MGACASTTDGDNTPRSKKAEEKKASLREIRARLAHVFEKMDSKKLGYVTHTQAMKFLMRSRRDLNSDQNKRMREVQNGVKKMFACSKASEMKDAISEDEFIAGYSNVIYPQNLTLYQLDNFLRKIFGRLAVGVENVHKPPSHHRIATM